MIPDAVDRDIILLTSLFQIADPDRRAEFRKCIELNNQNPHINKVVVFFEGMDSLSDLQVQYPIFRHDKTQVIPIEHRPSFKFFFDYANDHFAGQLIVVANADIFFDVTSNIELVHRLDQRNYLWVLTRYNFSEDRGTWELEDVGGAHRDVEMLGSHDAWVFWAPIKNFDNDIEIGKYGCDSYLSQKAAEASITLLNPSGSIRAKHEHKEPKAYGGRRDYQTRKDYLKFGVRSGFPPVSDLERRSFLTPARRRMEIMRYLLLDACRKVREWVRWR